MNRHTNRNPTVEIMQLFPTPLLYGKLERGLTEEERNCIDECCEDLRTNDANLTTVDTYVLKRPELANLNSWLTELSNQFLRNTFFVTGEFTLYITQSWINITKPGQYHHKHRHPNSILSGTFYINTIPNDTIQIYSNSRVHPLLYAYDFDFKDQNMYNDWLYSQSVINNNIVMFPSSLEHGVPINKSNDIRVSLSFNSFCRGTIGNRIDLTELVL